jgi:hypothetical protein
VDRFFFAALDADGMLHYHYPAQAAKFMALFGVTDERHIKAAVAPTGRPTKVAGREWDIFELQLNTALALGSDAIRFCARVHGQCEPHGYVEGRNRAWLAGIIDGGLKAGVLRHETQGYGRGWEDVADLLRQRDNCPVVMSYSVCDGFPSIPEHVEMPDAERDVWYESGGENRWATAMAWLRDIPGLELRPEDWATIRFGDEDVFTLRRAIETAMQ